MRKYFFPKFWNKLCSDNRDWGNLLQSEEEQNYLLSSKHLENINLLLWLGHPYIMTNVEGPSNLWGLINIQFRFLTKVFGHFKLFEHFKYLNVSEKIRNFKSLETAVPKSSTVVCISAEGSWCENTFSTIKIGQMERRRFTL